MRLIALTLTLALGFSLAPVAHADDALSTGKYLYTLPYYLGPDDDREATDGYGVSVGYGWRWTQRWHWEIQGFAAALDTDFADRTDFSQYGAGIDLLYEFSPGNFTPFALIGVGGVYNDVTPNSEDDFTAFGNAGLGLLSARMKNGLRFRLDGRYVHDSFKFFGSDSMSDWRVGLGVQIALGQRVVEREVVREKIVERIVTREVAAPLIDSDGDGVPDQNDDCPNTLKGLATDSRGCAVKQATQVVRLDGVLFEFDSARLLPASRQTLQRVAQSLRGQPDLKAEIAGHTDSVGPDGYNLKLSQQRAAAVQSFLVGEGINPGRLRARGYGESLPVASNDTPEGQAMNRRVEFRVLD